MFAEDQPVRAAYQLGEPVRVHVLGTWQPAVVLGAVGTGGVLVRYQRLDGEWAERAFLPSSVVEAGAF